MDDPVADEDLFRNEPWVEAPVKIDYGFNIKLGEGVFINFNCVFIDTCPITIGARTMFGPNVSLFSGTHPLDPAVRNGTEGPELGKPIHIGEDCWLGGNVIVLAGVTIGKGATIGAGSVVTKVCTLGPFDTEVTRKRCMGRCMEQIVLTYTGCPCFPCRCWESS